MQVSNCNSPYYIVLDPSKVRNAKQLFSNLSVNSVTLSWYEPEGKAEKYHVRWSPHREEDTVEPNRHLVDSGNLEKPDNVDCITYQIDDLTPGSTYAVSVVAESHGLHGKETVVDCYTSE